MSLPFEMVLNCSETDYFLINFQRADLAIADITITQERERDVDFTMPYMNLGELGQLLLCYNCLLFSITTVDLFPLKQYGVGRPV